MTSGTLTLYRIDEVVRRLEDSLRDLEFGLGMVPEQWIDALVPGAPADDRTVSMNLAHLAIYEDVMALPLLRSFEPAFDIASARRGGDESWFLNEAIALSKEPIVSILDRLRGARREQIELVQALGEERLNHGTTPLWPDPQHTAGWVATKTFQHTWDHGNAILRVALFAPR
ncbi:MAG: DinB family protein [Chloroflexota bacterium]|nr:DinB family protein [Chloroflexota bacterium]